LIFLISHLKKKTRLIHNLILQVLLGLVIASISALLIYFKQKPTLHHITVFLAVGSVYYIFNIFRSKVLELPKILPLFFLIVLIFICWIYPQFLYQIRPYTYYITGFSIGGIILSSVAGQLLQTHKSLFPWNIFVLLFGYLIGFWLPIHFLQYFTIGLLLIYLVLYVVLIKPGFKYTLALGIIFVLASQLYLQFSHSIIIYPEQKNYEDKVVFTSETQFHKLVITQWKEDYWFFIDKLKNICSIDEYLFYEPMAHSTFHVSENIGEVLVIGGENGCLIREILKYDDLSIIDVVSYDTLLRKLGQENPFFTEMNQHSLDDQNVNLIDADLLDYVSNTDRKYDAVFIDLPDPRSIETNQYYTKEFYSIIREILKYQGIMMTQAGSPYFATEAYYSIGKTIEQCGFEVLPIHNQILTLGEWGWYVCSTYLSEAELKNKITNMDNVPVETEWWDPGAAKLVTSFGKTYSDTLNVGINTLDDPLVYQFYLKGNWDMN